MRAGIVAVQGAFREHELALERLGVSWTELRQKKDLEKAYDAIILPGGESTVQGKLIKELDMFSGIKEKIESGMPVLATCAGLILLAQDVSNDTRSYFQTLPVTVKRNAYGRQLGSFHTTGKFGGMESVPMTFIRAPYIEKADENVEILAEVRGYIAAVRYENQLAMSSHPELDENPAVYEMFIRMTKERNNQGDGV